MRNYQYNYSDINRDMLEKSGRLKKAMKIINVLQTEIGLSDKKCLDIGCSGGIITSYLSNYFSEIVGCDIDEKAINKATAEYTTDTCRFVCADSMNLPFDDNSFDVVICNHIYEHVPDSSILISEIYRILKRGGICYFGAGNRYMIKENHYKLYFLSWLPQFLADRYLKLVRGIDHYYEKHLSFSGLKKLVSSTGFSFNDYTEKIILVPSQFSEDDTLLFKIIRSMPGVIRRILIRRLTQTFIWTLKKGV